MTSFEIRGWELMDGTTELDSSQGSSNIKK